MTVTSGRLADFVVSRRMLAITALALPIGALSAGAAWCLIRLIGLVTNLVFYQRWGTDLVAPGAQHHPWWLILGARVAGGLVVGVMARFGSDKIRGHGMPEAIEAILTRGSRIEPKVAILKPLSAAISIGTGGPFGAEGPIIATVHSGPIAQANGTSWVHTTGAVLAILGGNAAILAGSSIVRNVSGPWYRGASGGLVLLGLLSFTLLVIGLKGSTLNILPPAVWERCSVYSITAWQMFTAAHLLTHNR
jgi:Voltage gated chloride channel